MSQTRFKGRFNDKAVLITGGSQGLGFSLGRAWAREGAKVVLGCTASLSPTS